MSFPKFKESLKPQIDSKSEVTPDTDLLLIQVAHQKDEENNRHKIKIYALRLFAGLGGTMIIVYIYHLLMPSWARWLSPSEMASRAFDHDWRIREFGDQVHYEIASLHITSKASALPCRGFVFDTRLQIEYSSRVSAKAALIGPQ